MKSILHRINVHYLSKYYYFWLPLICLTVLLSAVQAVEIEQEAFVNAVHRCAAMGHAVSDQ